MTIVRAIIKEVKTHWICVTSACRWVIIAGTATFTEPIITEFVSEPRIIDRLMAERAEDTVTAGISTVLAEVVEASGWVGVSRGPGTGLLFSDAIGGESCHPLTFCEQTTLPACTLRRSAPLHA